MITMYTERISILNEFIDAFDAAGTNWSGTTNRETVDFTWSEIAASAGTLHY